MNSNTQSNKNLVNFLETATPKQKVTAGLIMWFAFYLGYFTFCLNWLMFSHVKGSLGETHGWLNYFTERGLGTDPSTIGVKSDAVNYSITLIRGIAAIAVGWVMTKLSHKRASIVALALNTFALPLIFAPRYELLVLGRMFMAAGGTMLIILIQPVISNFFDLKMKGVLSTVTSTAYILAAIFAHLLFVYEGGDDKWLHTWFLENWRLVTGLCAGLTYIPLVLYILYGKHFVAGSSSPDNKEHTEILPQNTYSGVIKEKNTWLWVIIYSLLLVASLLVSLKVPALIKKINSNLINSLSATGLSWSMVYNCCFYFGCLAGMVWGRWAKTQYQRKPIIIFCCGMSFICWLFILLGMHLKDVAAGSVICFYFAFFFAFFGIGIQPVMLYVPHEYEENKNNSKRLTIFFAYLWGIGYILFTIYQIIVVSCLDMDSGKDTTTGSYLGIGLITLFVLLFAVLSLFIKESRPNYKFFPGLNKWSDLIHKERLE